MNSTARPIVRVLMFKGMEMGGKTGTAQVQRITAEMRRLGIKNEDLPWEQRHHALFVGYAPIADPRYVCSVVVEHGVGGSTAAAPIAKILLEQTQRRDPAGTRLQPEEPEIKEEDITPSEEPFVVRTGSETSAGRTRRHICFFHAAQKTKAAGSARRFR